MAGHLYPRSGLLAYGGRRGHPRGVVPSPFLARLAEIARDGERTALRDDDAHRGASELAARVALAAAFLAARFGDGKSLAGQRFCLLASPEIAWVECLLGV